MKKWLEELDDDDSWNEFLENNGPAEIFDVLSKEELKARETHNYHGVLELLKIINIITSFEDGL